jgi:predicted adenine nucleotide alpha hydrolase (AANH) superfamily ATPase
MKMRSKAKTGSYPDVNEGDNVRIQMIHKTPKGFKQQWSTDLHKVQKDYHNGVYKVDGDLYPRKEIQLVKGDVIKLPEKPKQQQASINKMDKIGKAAYNPELRDLTQSKLSPKKVETMIDESMKLRGKKIDFVKLSAATFRKPQTKKYIFYISKLQIILLVFVSLLFFDIIVVS